MANLSGLDALRTSLQSARDDIEKVTNRLSQQVTLAGQVGANALMRVRSAELQIAKSRLEALRSAQDRISAVTVAMSDLEATGYPKPLAQSEISKEDRAAADADLENLRSIFMDEGK